MIRIGTVFSGIGAIEHALKRMNLEHKIVFACDSGDVDVLSKDVESDMVEIRSELNTLEKLISRIKINDKEDELYKKELDFMLSKIKNEYGLTNDSLKGLDDINLLKKVVEILNNVIDSDEIKPAQKKRIFNVY